MINDKSLSDVFTLVKSSADGHCIIHSITSCLHHYNTSVDKHDIYNFLLHSLRAECLRNSRLYLPFFETIELFDDERDRYIFTKQFDLSFVDLVPQMLANALYFGITIVNEESRAFSNVYEFVPAVAISAIDIHVSKVLHCPTKILLYRCGYHYDACVPICSKNHVASNEPRSDLFSDVQTNVFSDPPADDVGQHCANAGSRHLPVGVDEHESGIKSFPLAGKSNSENKTCSGVSCASISMPKAS